MDEGVKSKRQQHKNKQYHTMRAPSPYAETDVNSVDLGACDESDNENVDSEQPSSSSEDRYKEFIGEFVRGNTKFRGTVRLFVNDKDEEELLNHGKGQKIKSRDKNDGIHKDSNKGKQSTQYSFIIKRSPSDVLQHPTYYTPQQLYQTSVYLSTTISFDKPM